MRLNRNWWIGVLVLLVSLTAFQNPAIAQLGSANVHGIVTDSSGAVVPNATVTITNTGTNYSQHASTDSKGYYVFPQVETGGPYVLTITASGFQAFKATKLMLPLNASREIDAALEVGSSATTVQVQASQVAVETSDTQLKTELGSATIEDLPLIGRDVTELQKTAPGVVEASDRFGTFSSNGNQTPQNSYIFDGVDINDGPLQNEGFRPDPDSLGQFQIVLSTLNPEYARNSGAIDLESSKSGGNAFHGEGFEFYRQNFMNAVPFTEQSGAHYAPPYHRNLYGGNLGGPLIKNKLFFFVSYQGIRQDTAGNSNSFVFSPAQLAGTFSGVTGNATPADPSTGTPANPGNLVPFTIGNCQKGMYWSQCFGSGTANISPSDFNPIAQALVNKYVPAANGTTGGLPAYFFNTADTEASDQAIMRLDYKISSKDTIWTSVSFQSEPTTETLPFTGATLPGFGQIDARHFKVFSATETHIFSPTLVNELRGGYYRFNYKAVNPTNPVAPSSLGFNISPQDAVAGDVPTISIQDGPTLGFSTNGPQPRIDTNMEFADNVSKVVGNHNLKFGARYEQFRVSNPFYGNNSGDYSFAGSGTYSSGNPTLDFLLGIPDSYVQSSGGFIDARAQELYAYLQDNWKASDSLTVNYGVAWDSESPNQNEQYDGLGISCFVLSNQTSTVYPGGPPGLLYPGDKGCNKAGGPTTKYNHFGPRVGFAYSPTSGPKFLIGNPGNHEFSVRGGFGIYYNRDQEEGSLQNLETPPTGKTTHGAADFAGSPAFANPFQDIYTGQSEASPIPFAPPPPGTALDWTSFAGLDMNAFSKGYTTPIVYNFNLNIQRQLPGSIILTVGYVGSLAHHLINVVDGDPITPAGHAACLADPSCVANRAFQHDLYPQNTAVATVASPTDSAGLPYYLSVGTQSSQGNSNYNSLQIQVQKAQTHGLTFNLSYTYSHALDDASGLESSGFNGRGYNSYPGFQYLNYGNSDFDARQRLSYYLIYEVPTFQFMKHNFAMREALAGWSISGFGAIQSGNPVTLMETSGYNSGWCDAYNYYYCPDSPNTSTYHETTYSDPRAHNDMGFDPTPFSAEPIGTFGNTKRNYFAGPHFNYANAAVFKNFYLGAGSGRYVQIRMDANNVFNHTNFASPDGNFSDGSAFGTISGVYAPPVADGDPAPARIVELAGKIVF